ncbi:MAG: hypothetical protein UT84_C0002G0072 [Candidatus Curtissbacteria bacterium GW2011_GWA1_40_16]|uniref:Uncharacterized protein n=1 Tax=Candidatus Curtissbacteria bacterium GW2011_GWA1_40_16 TaxID=1618405 RepID=A0A0G0RMW3_9BACT|nr:MAG: hypothetical protein UT84_C0002G0072 [Candidatus Curtissbacteria bacterium GW2011_GWA1_40_16]
MMESEPSAFLSEVAKRWEKHAGDIVPTTKLAEAVVARQELLASQNGGKEVSEITALVSILAERGMNPDQITHTINDCTSIIHPTSLLLAD